MARTAKAPPNHGDAFPTTQSTYLGRILAAGRLGRLEAGRHVMSVYKEPLKVYLRGSSFRDLGDADELVEGFFADRLEREGFLTDWVRSGRRFRFWVIRAFKNYLREQARAAQRWKEMPQRARDAAERHPVVGPEAKFHREAALALVREGIRLAHDDCRTAGQEEHWHVFLRHHLDGQDYQTIAAALGITPVRAGVMTRTASTKFKARLRELVAWSGASPKDLDDEIRALTQVLCP